MPSAFFCRSAMALVAVVCVVGIVDAAVGRSWDHVALHALVLVVTGAVLTRSLASRREVTVRADLYRWYERRASDAAEPIGAVIDRALAAQRDLLGAGTTPSDPDGPGAG